MQLPSYLHWSAIILGVALDARVACHEAARARRRDAQVVHRLAAQELAQAAAEHLASISRTAVKGGRSKGGEGRE